VATEKTNRSEPVVIKKYANRRLYNTATSTYVTLEDLAVLVKDDVDFVVYDAKSGDDITRSVLTQIIFEQENKGDNLLPINFLRQLIAFYGDSMQSLVPTYLDFSMNSLTREQDTFRNQVAQAFGQSPFKAVEDQVRQNMEMFEQAMGMFMPGAPMRGGESAPRQDTTAKESNSGSEGEIEALKAQLDQMQRQLNALAPKEDKTKD